LPLESSDISPTNDTLVRFDQVDYSHPNGTVALRNVNFELSKAELVAILGSNGAGKTTLVRHINGLLKPTHGTVSVFGKDTKLQSVAELSKRVGIVFQNANNQLFANSVRAEIEFALKNFKLSDSTVKQRTDWALNTFSLLEYADKAPMELSGGEKKRLCLALVLAWEPDILILDEPTVGQDSDQKERLSETIRLLLTQSKSVIVVSHDIEFVWHLQPRTILMSNGEILADGPAQAIMSDMDVMTRASVFPPSLVSLWKLLKIPAPFPEDAPQADASLKPVLDWKPLF
jgi:energy-coupling factor transporter ATP-binding protein EcfA2